MPTAKIAMSADRFIRVGRAGFVGWCWHAALGRDDDDDDAPAWPGEGDVVWPRAALLITHADAAGAWTTRNIHPLPLHTRVRGPAGMGTVSLSHAGPSGHLTLTIDFADPRHKPSRAPLVMTAAALADWCPRDARLPEWRRRAAQLERAQAGAARR